MKDIKAFLKKKKKSDNMVVNNTKIYEKVISNSLISIEKIFKAKSLIIVIRNYSLISNNFGNSFDEKYKDVLKSQF